MELIEKTFGSILAEHVQNIPNNEFIVYPDRNLRFTYKDFDIHTDNFAKSLLAIGVKKGDKVGIWATNVPDWLSLMFACAKIGAVLVTVNTNYKNAELEYILDNADIHTLCLIDSYRDSNYVDIVNQVVPELKSSKKGELHCEKLPLLKNVILSGDKEVNGMFSSEKLIEMGKSLPNDALEAAKKEVTTHDIVNMQYTSGTTGFPKGVMLTHYNILNNGLTIGDCMNYTNSDRLLVCVPLFHCFGCVLALCAIVTHGGTMVMVEEFDPLKVLTFIEAEKCTAVYGVPTMFLAELHHPLFNTFDLSTLRTGIMAGAPCPIDTMNEVMEKMYCKDIIIVYGLTESSPGMTATRTTDSSEIRSTTVGRALPFVDVKITNPVTGEDSAVGEIGEICCKGYNIMKGYYKNPEATEAIIDKNGFLHSGDLGVMDENGYFKVTGRIKEMIIRGGENVYPREIENFLYKMEQIHSVEVVGLTSPKYGEQVAAFVKVKDGQTLTEEQIIEYCSGNIARYKIPKYYFFVEDFPMTASGKIQKYKLKDLGLELLKERGVEII